MALEDKVIYEKKLEEVETVSKGLMEVVPVLLQIDKKVVEYLGIKWYLIKDGYLLQYNQSVAKELEKLEKYMHCAHIDTRTESTGNDSHKDYYQEVCKKCGKVIKEWSI